MAAKKLKYLGIEVSGSSQCSSSAAIISVALGDPGVVTCEHCPGTKLNAFGPSRGAIFE